MGLFSNKKNQEELTGVNIYKDKKNRTIYYNKFTKSAYVLKPQHYASFRRFSTRFLLPILSFILISGIAFDQPILNMPYPIPISIVVSILIYLVIAFKFYRSFLPSLTSLPAFVPIKKDTMIDSLRKADLSKSIVKTVLLILISVLFAVNAQQVYEKNAIEYMLYLNYALSAGAGILALLQLYALITRKHAKPTLEV